MTKSEKLITISTIILVGFFVACLVFYILGKYMNLPGPYNSFLFYSNTPFSDFFETLPKTAFSRFVGVYFPLTYIFLAPLTLVSKNVAFVIFISIFICFHSLVNLKVLKCDDLNSVENFKNFFIITYLAYPFLMILDRGNFDMVLYMFLVLAIYMFYKKKYMASALFFAIENAMKPFPSIFILLFLLKKKYKEFFISIFISAILVIGGFAILKGSFTAQIKTFFDCLNYYKQYYWYDYSDFVNLNASSLLEVFKFFLIKHANIISIYSLIKYYSYFVYSMVPVTIYFVWKEKSFWKQLMFISLYTCLVPDVVEDYKLLFMFIPMLFFINSKASTKYTKAYAILFGLLMIPKHFLLFNLYYQSGYHMWSCGNLVNPVLMCIFFVLLGKEQIFLRKTQSVSETD